MGAIPGYDPLTTPANDDILYIIQSLGSNRDRNITVSALLDSERSRLSALETLTGNITNGTQPLEAISVATGKKTITEKKTTITSSDTGWNTIALTGAIASSSCAVFIVIFNLAAYRVSVSVTGNSSTRTAENTSIKIENISSSISFDPAQILGVRLVCPESTSDEGFVLQVKLVLSSDSTLLVHKAGNTGSYDDAGWTLVSAYKDESPVTLPDGSTSTTFLYSGDTIIRALSSPSYSDPRVTCYALSATSLMFTLQFDDTPDRSLTTITFPVSAAMYKYKGGTPMYFISAGETMPITGRSGKTIVSLVTSSGLTAGDLGVLVGAGMSVKLS